MESGKVWSASRGAIELNEASAGSPAGVSDSHRNGRRTYFRAILTLALTGYWVLMFTGTHIPELPATIELVSDKLIHFCAYFGLSILLLVWRSTRGKLVWTAIFRIWFVIAAYGIFDEFTQQFFGRDTDIADWLADVSGVTLGLAIAWPIAIRFPPVNNQ